MLSAYTRDDAGVPRRDKYFEHVSDAFKLGLFYISKKLVNDQELPVEEPQYYTDNFDTPTRERIFN